MARGRASLEDGRISDIELVDTVIRSVPGAFDKFYGQYGQLIRGCIRKRAEARDVDDLFQGFFLHLIKNDYRVLLFWQRGNSLPIYLSVVVKNYVIDFQRRHRPGESRGDTSDLEGILDTDPSRPENQETITTALELKDLRRSGIKAWAELEARDRSLMCDKLHRNLSNEAIAQRLQNHVGTIRTAISRGQFRLMGHLRKLAPEYFPDQV